ncbi:MAG: hypothetical protein KAT65_18460 [Methanophagales archaeon]|nr:hypothetical protein [Methanophagales archaeon]
MVAKLLEGDKSEKVDFGGFLDREKNRKAFICLYRMVTLYGCCEGQIKGAAEEKKEV